MDRGPNSYVTQQSTPQQERYMTSWLGWSPGFGAITNLPLGKMFPSRDVVSYNSLEPLAREQPATG